MIQEGQKEYDVGATLTYTTSGGGLKLFFWGGKLFLMLCVYYTTDIDFPQFDGDYGQIRLSTSTAMDS